MTTINTKPFDQQMQVVLSGIHSAYHAAELSLKPAAELPERIHLIEHEGEMVGYGVIWAYKSGKQLVHKAETDYFSQDERYLERDFYIDITNKTDIIFIEALDILKDYERRGYAAFFIKWLKETYPNKKMYVYTLNKSRNFWFKMGFDVLGTTAWMSFN